MIVTITAYKRPELLKKCLESIETAHLGPVTEIHISFDYHSDEMTALMIKVCKSCIFDKYFGPTKTRLGVANHPRALFNKLVYSDICALEEDTIVSPDTFLFAEWALKQPGYKFVNLARGPNFFHNATMLSTTAKWFSEVVHEDNELRSPYGWAFTADFWRLLEPQWNGKIRAPYGWDWQLTHLCYREGWHCLTPEVSRVYNTGRENGTYDTPANWDATQRDVVICQTVPYKYIVTKHSSLDTAPVPAWVADEMKL
jgi:hypothetical protein